ncbi:MAG TPA: hypothetical protein VME70_15825 [Mycobacteriales bacterium]|nr:hypothetical protein [Mycobacteriales bacterium]
MSVRHRIAASVAGVTVIGLGAGGVAYADSSGGTPSTPASAATLTASTHGRLLVGARRHPLLRRLLHGEFVLRAKGGPVTVDVQQGKVTAVSATSITLQSSDGTTDSYTVTQATKVRSRGHKIPESDIITGDHAWVIAIDSNGTKTARAIRGVRRASSAA